MKSAVRCRRSDCLRGSQVIYHFDPPNSAAFPGIWHKRETAVSATLDEPSRTFSPFAIDLSTRRMHRVATLSDGSKTYYVDGGVNGPKWRASLSSASRDEHASQANLERSAVALKGAKN
jgi:hypothetical protein